MRKAQMTQSVTTPCVTVVAHGVIFIRDFYTVLYLMGAQLPTVISTGDNSWYIVLQTVREFATQYIAIYNTWSGNRYYPLSAREPLFWPIDTYQSAPYRGSNSGATTLVIRIIWSCSTNFTEVSRFPSNISQVIWLRVAITGPQDELIFIFLTTSNIVKCGAYIFCRAVNPVYV